MSRRLDALAVFVVGAVTLQACTTSDLSRSCSWSDSDLSKVDTSSLGVVLGAPANRFLETPFIMLSTPSPANPQAKLELKLTPAPMLWPNSLDETPCKGLDWRTFRVAVDADQWAELWALPRPLLVHWDLAFSNSMAPLRTKSFGVALVNAATGEVHMSCGCYRT
jgi:hypothetical protein